MSARFAGYAAIFDVVDRGGDVVRRGAFGRVGPVPLLIEHDRRRSAGVIERIEEDERGLRVIGLVRDGVPVTPGTGLSFGYRVKGVDAPAPPLSGHAPPPTPPLKGRGEGMRELTNLELIEVSLVNRPMQPLARVHAVESG